VRDLYSITQLLGKNGCTTVRGNSEYRQLLATLAEGGVPAPNDVLDGSGDPLEHLIARDVPVRIIDLLEVVNVDGN
jgi:hypothetical protein